MSECVHCLTAAAAYRELKTAGPGRPGPDTPVEVSRSFSFTDVVEFSRVEELSQLPSSTYGVPDTLNFPVIDSLSPGGQLFQVMFSIQTGHSLHFCKLHVEQRVVWSLSLQSVYVEFR